LTYVLDTDTVNYLVKGVPQVVAAFRAANEQGASFLLSGFVHYEVTRYHRLRGTPRITRVYQALVSDWPRLDLSGADWDTAADLWSARHASGQPIADSDLLIGLCALKNDAILVTNNTRHFQDLGISLANWAVR
jgi:tRNA(fMet)-specific endonuclease VapC